MAEALERASWTRAKAIKGTTDAHRKAYAQHLTPPETARLAASMFSEQPSNRPFVSCLDLGGGTGMLSVALIERYEGRVSRMDTIEMDQALAEVFEREVRPLSAGETIIGDAITTYLPRRYDRIILNPPYGKMSASDPRQNILPTRSPNLYTAFMLVGLSLLADEGEMVAIVPRSWTNGDYFKPFRRFVLSNYSIDALHLYGSRSEVFADTSVLQETMLVRLSKRSQSPTIRVSQSPNKGDVPTVNEWAYDDIVVGTDLVVRAEPSQDGNLSNTIEGLGLCPSTGKVVDFRCRDRTYAVRPEGRHTVPLVYVGNLRGGTLTHPRGDLGKPQWFADDDDWGKAQLMPLGSFVVVKRFSSKEEPRRVVAYPLDVDEPLALENHSTFIHAGRPRNVVPLRSPDLARGIAMWLNTTFIDEWFRGVSGSTQVNARDIRQMPCPTLEELEELGKSWSVGMTQEQIDKQCEGFTKGTVR